MAYFAKSLLWASAALVVVAIMGSLVSSQLAAHGGNGATNIIHACVNSNSGAIRIVDANDTCRNNESPLDWNGPDISGNAAPATALAANGNNCSAGQFAQGVDASGNAEGCASVATGITGYERVLGSFGTSTDVFTPTLTASCSSGKKILGGGVEYNFVSGGRPFVVESYPSSETQWTAHVEKLVDGTPDFQARAIAICGNAS